MGVKQFLAGQMRMPSGWFGSTVVLRLLNVMNRAIIDSTISRMALEPHHQVLEIGFGGGAAVTQVSRLLREGTITGVDFSPDMVRAARRRFSREISQGRIRIEAGDVAALPFASACFDRVFTINTIYFWPETVQGLREIRRVLKPGGRVVVALRSRENMERVSFTKHGFRLFSPAEIPPLMAEAGFTNVEVTHERQGTRVDEVMVTAVA